MAAKGYGHDKDDLLLMMHSSQWIKQCYNTMKAQRRKKGERVKKKAQEGRKEIKKESEVNYT